MPVNTTATRTLTISNSGTDPLTISGISYPPGFSGNWSSGSIAGGSQNVTVTFAPVALVGYGGNLIVSANQTSGPTTRFLSGTGTQPPANDAFANRITINSAAY